MLHACSARAAASGRACRVHMRVHVRACALFLQHDKAEAAGLVDGADCADACRDRQLPVCDWVWVGWVRWMGLGLGGGAEGGGVGRRELGGGRWEVVVAGGGVGVGAGAGGGRGGWRSGAAAAVAVACGCSQAGGCPGPPWATHREACEAVEVGRVRVLVHEAAEKEADRGEEAQQLQRGHVDYGLAHRGAVPETGLRL